MSFILVLLVSFAFAESKGTCFKNNAELKAAQGKLGNLANPPVTMMSNVVFGNVSGFQITADGTGDGDAFSYVQVDKRMGTTSMKSQKVKEICVEGEKVVIRFANGETEEGKKEGDKLKVGFVSLRPASPAEFEQLRSRARGGGGGVGSSRVDLQACKLEYSIVSPK